MGNKPSTTKRAKKSKPHKCRVCGKGFGQKFNRNKHERTVHKPKPFKPRKKRIVKKKQPKICPECNKSFLFESRLREHRKKHFPAADECNHCHKKLSNKGALRRHIKSQHTSQS